MKVDQAQVQQIFGNTLAAQPILMPTSCSTSKKTATR